MFIILGRGSFITRLRADSGSEQQSHSGLNRRVAASIGFVSQHAVRTVSVGYAGGAAAASSIRWIVPLPVPQPNGCILSPALLICNQEVAHEHRPHREKG